MPALSLLPLPTGTIPESKPARVNGETDGREGKDIVGIISSVEVSTRTRSFQSYIEEDAQSDSAKSKSSSKNQTQNGVTDSTSNGSTVANPATVYPPIQIALPLPAPTNTSSVSPLAVSMPASGKSSSLIASTQSGAITQNPIAAASASPTPASVQQQTITLPQSMPSEVLSALSSAQFSIKAALPSSNSGLGATTNKDGSSGNAKASMDRSQVLGESPPTPTKSVIAKNSVETGAGSSGESSASTDKSDVAAGQNASGGAFSTALNGAAQSTAGPTNAEIIQGSSQAERLQVMSQISQHIQSMLPSTANPNTMTVTVQPPEWGQVTIAVTLNPADATGSTLPQVSTTVTASTPEVQSVLQQHVQDLKDSLGAAGIQLDKVNVGLGTVAATGQTGNSTGHHTGQQGAGSDSQAYQSTGNDNFAGSGWSSGQQSAFDSMANDDTVSVASLSSAASEAASINTASAGVISGTTHVDMKA